MESPREHSLRFLRFLRNLSLGIVRYRRVAEASQGQPPHSKSTWWRTRPGSLLRQHFLHYFSEDVSRGQRDIRTSEKTPFLTLTE